MDIKQLILRAEVDLERIQKERARAIAAPKAIIAAAQAEGRSHLTEEEDVDIRQHQARADKLKGDEAGVNSQLTTLRETEAREAEADAVLSTARSGAGAQAVANLPAYDRVARVGAEERTYHNGNDRKGTQFLNDVVLAFLYRNPESEGRITRHQAEERVERAKYNGYVKRAAGTGAFAGLTVPQYLTDMYAPATSSMRPFADTCNHHDLPESGMTVNISRITTATSAAKQASENSAVSETNIDDTLLTENVLTFAGQQTLSRQAIERGTGIEDVTFNDLFRRYGAGLDSSLILDSTTGLKAVATLQTYTDGSPTGPKIYSQIIGAASTVETNLLGFAIPDLAVMSPRRWYSLLSAMASTWPLIGSQNLPTQSTGANNGSAYGAGIRGILPNGIRVCVDSNLETNLGGGTNQDQIYVTASEECHLWEDPSAPVLIRAEQLAAASLGVTLVLYGYYAYSFRRYTSSAVKIDGTGLVTPTFLGS